MFLEWPELLINHCPAPGATASHGMNTVLPSRKQACTSLAKEKWNCTDATRHCLNPVSSGSRLEICLPSNSKKRDQKSKLLLCCLCDV